MFPQTLTGAWKMEKYTPRFTIRDFTEKTALPKTITNTQTLSSYLTNPDQLQDKMRLRIYEQKDVGILVSLPFEKENKIIEIGKQIEIVDTSILYCKWHDKPIDDENAVERRYCYNQANPITGFCEKHYKSDKSFYERCFMINDPKYREYCKEIDKIYNREIEYIIYLQVTHDLKIKVGVTRKKRFLKRLSEQPHIIGLPLFITNSAVTARETEIHLSSKLGLTQSSKASQHFILTTPLIEKAYNILITKKEEILSNPPKDLQVVDSDPIIIYTNIKDCSKYRKGTIKGWLSGFIYNNLVIKTNNGECYKIKLNQILHKPSIYPL